MRENIINKSKAVGDQTPTASVDNVNDKINVYGTLYNNSTTGRLAVSKQIYDLNEDEYQDIINSRLKNNIETTNVNIDNLELNINNKLGSKADLDQTGKIPINQLPDSIVNDSLKRVIVESLPPVGQNNVIYLILKTILNPNETPEEGDIYDEYMWLNNKWEKIGNTKTDLSDYYTKEEVYNKTESTNNIKHNAIIYSDEQNLNIDQKKTAIKNIGLDIVKLPMNFNNNAEEERLLDVSLFNKLRTSKFLTFTPKNDEDIFSNVIFVKHNELNIDNTIILNFYSVSVNNFLVCSCYSDGNNTGIICDINNIVNITSEIGNSEYDAASQKLVTRLFNEAKNANSPIIIEVGNSTNIDKAIEYINNNNFINILIKLSDYYYPVISCYKYSKYIYYLYISKVVTNDDRTNKKYLKYLERYIINVNNKTLTLDSNREIIVNIVESTGESNTCTISQRFFTNKYNELLGSINNFSSWKEDTDQSIFSLYCETILNKLKFDFTSSTDIIRADLSNKVKLSWNITRIDDDEEYIPDEFKIKNVATGAYLNNIRYDQKFVELNMQITTTYRAEYYVGGSFRKKDITIKSVRPIFFGNNTLDSITTNNIATFSALIKEYIGNSEINVQLSAVGNYIWIAIPSDQDLSLIIKDSIPIPFELKHTVTFSTVLGEYKCYRTISGINTVNNKLLLI